MYLVQVFRAVIRVLHDLSVLHVVVILCTFCIYFLRINIDGWMDKRRCVSTVPPRKYKKLLLMQ